MYISVCVCVSLHRDREKEGKCKYLVHLCMAASVIKARISYNYRPGSCAAQFSLVKKKKHNRQIVGRGRLNVGHGTSKYRKLETSKPRLFPVANNYSQLGMEFVGQNSHTVYKRTQTERRFKGHTEALFLFAENQEKRWVEVTRLQAEPSRWIFFFFWFSFTFCDSDGAFCYFRGMRVRERLVPENMAASFFCRVWGEK